MKATAVMPRFQNHTW